MIISRKIGIWDELICENRENMRFFDYKSGKRY